MCIHAAMHVYAHPAQSIQACRLRTFGLSACTCCELTHLEMGGRKDSQELVFMVFATIAWGSFCLLRKP